MKLTAHRLFLSLGLLLLIPHLAAASVTPTSVAIRWQVGTRSYSNDLTHIPSVSMAWSKGGTLALWSEIGYLRESYGSSRRIIPEVYPFSPFLTERASAPSYRTHLVPVTLGMRAYLREATDRPRGPYLEAGPTVTLASYTSELDHRSRFALLGGFRAGLGLRFGAIDGSLGEIGMSYYLAEAVGKYPDAMGRIGTPGEADVGVFGAYVSLGVGD